MATPKMNQWQNQFDQEILNVAQEDNIPPLLLKNLFLRESQLWPGTYHDIKEVGFGQITENGADTLLLWNKEFYNSFCSLALDQGVCSKGYTNLSDERQALLRRVLLRSSNASCPKCDTGIDELKANYSIHIFAETIRANCTQVSQLVSNITQKPVRGLVGYDDLWRFTLVNYNAGSVCLGNALERTWEAKQPIDWDHAMPNIDPACQSAVEYVVDISDNETKTISSFSTPLPTATVITTPTPTPTSDTTPTLSNAITPVLARTTNTLTVFREPINNYLLVLTKKNSLNLTPMRILLEFLCPFTLRAVGLKPYYISKI